MTTPRELSEYVKEVGESNVLASLSISPPRVYIYLEAVPGESRFRHAGGVTVLRSAASMYRSQSPCRFGDEVWRREKSLATPEAITVVSERKPEHRTSLFFPREWSCSWT